MYVTFFNHLFCQRPHPCLLFLVARFPPFAPPKCVKVVVCIISSPPNTLLLKWSVMILHLFYACTSKCATFQRDSIVPKTYTLKSIHYKTMDHGIMGNLMYDVGVC